MLWTGTLLLAVCLGLLGLNPAWLAALIGIALATAIGFMGAEILLGFVIITAGLSFGFLADGAQAGLGRTIGVNIDALRLAVVLCGFGALAFRDLRLLSPVRSIGLYLAFLVYALATLAWSPSKLDGSRLFLKLVYPTVAYVLAVWAVRSRGEDLIVSLVLWSSIAALLLNLLAAVSGGISLGEGYDARFHGAAHPNTVGQFCSAAGLTLYAYRGRGHFYAVVLVALGALLVATGSRTSFIAGGVGLVVFETLRGRWRRTLLVTLLGASLWLIVPALGQRTTEGGANLGIGAEGIGPDLNLSGRALLWADAWAELRPDRAMLGKGLGATDQFFRERYSDIASIHNGYLLLLVDTGYVGLILVVAFLVSTGLRQFSRVRRNAVSGSPIHALACAMLCLYLLSSFAESTFAGYASETSILWVVIGCAMGSGYGIKPPGPAKLHGNRIVASLDPR